MSEAHKDQYDALVRAVDAYVADGTVSVSLPNGFSVVRDGTAERRRLRAAVARINEQRVILGDFSQRVIAADKALSTLLEAALEVLANDEEPDGD